MDVRYVDRSLSSSPPGASFKEVWPQIEPLIKSIFSNDTLSKSDWQKIFWKVHSVCMWDPQSAFDLLQKLKELFMVYILHEKDFIMSHFQSHQSLMRAYMIAWKRFMFYYAYVPLPFAPLEKIVFNHRGPVGGENLKKNDETENFLRLSMIEMWVLYIFSQVSNELVHGAMLLVDSERKNIHSDPQLIIGVKDSCVCLCKYLPNSSYIYQQNFESVYLATIERFYQTKGEEYYGEKGVLAYIKWVDQKIKEETERADRYLEPSSLNKVISTCVATLIARYRDQFAEKFLDLIKTKDIVSLNLMFTLLDLVDKGIVPLLDRFEQYITNVGMNNLQMEARTIVQDSEKYIENLLKLFDMATELIHDAFNMDSRFLTRRDIAINVLINDKSIFTMNNTLKQLNTLNINEDNKDSNQAQTTTADNAAANKDSSNTQDVQDNSNCENTSGVEAEQAASQHQPQQQSAICNETQNKTQKHMLMNLNSRNAELFANYCDLYLRRTNISRYMSSEQIEMKLKNVILLLKYLHDKDIFMKFYKAHLTRRLILELSVDLDKEEQMVNWLREVGMPADYVNRISRMFQDIKVSEDFNHQYKMISSGGGAPSPPTTSNNTNTPTNNSTATAVFDKQAPVIIDDFMFVKILNSSTWSRNYEKVNVTLPTEIEELLPRIESFYKRKHSGRNLFWYHPFSYGVVTFNSDMGTYDFDVTSYQLSILSCWNERPNNEAITLEQLILSTQLPNSELKRTLLSLVANPKLKTQVLIAINSADCSNEDSTTNNKQQQLKSSNIKSVKELRDSTKFKLNLKFALYGKNGRIMKRGRFNLIGRLQLQSEKFREEETENILKLRSLRTQEAIMKIMKTRKSITFNALQLELANVLKEMFVPSKSLIKDQLEWLIENQYLQRSQYDNTLINYY